MTDRLKVFGVEFGDQRWVADSIYSQVAHVGLFEFLLHEHDADYPDSPHHGWVGYIECARHLWSRTALGLTKTPEPVIEWMESEARRLISETLGLVGP